MTVFLVQVANLILRDGSFSDIGVVEAETIPEAVKKLGFEGGGEGERYSLPPKWQECLDTKWAGGKRPIFRLEPLPEFNSLTDLVAEFGKSGYIKRKKK